MNLYVEILLWAISLYFLAIASMHIVQVFRDPTKPKSALWKAIIYLVGAIALVVLLIFKPFKTHINNLTRRSKRGAMESEAVLISTAAMTDKSSVST